MLHHLNNPVYGVLIDSIVNSYLQTRGGYDVARAPVVGIVARSHCDFFRPARYPGALLVGLRVVRVGARSVVYEVGVFMQGEGGVGDAACAVGGFTQIWVERESNRVAEGGVPEWVRRCLRPLMKGGEPEGEPERGSRL